LTNSQTSTWSFTSATALQSVSISFFYSVPGADTGFFKFASNSTVALPTRPAPRAVPDQQPGCLDRRVAKANDFDGSFSATYTNLAPAPTR